jgi:hypothetical protein
MALLAHEELHILFSEGRIPARAGLPLLSVGGSFPSFTTSSPSKSTATAFALAVSPSCTVLGRWKMFSTSSAPARMSLLPSVSSPSCCSIGWWPDSGLPPFLCLGCWIFPSRLPSPPSPARLAWLTQDDPQSLLPVLGLHPV